MNPSRVAALLLLSVLIGVAHPAGDQKTSDSPKNQKVDAFGDPLPSGVLMRMGTIRFRHGAQIQMLQYSHDGKVLASMGVDQTIRLWDTDSGKELQSFHVPEAANTPFALSPDGKCLATISSFSRIRIWDTKKGTETHAIDDQNGNVTAAVFSPDGKTLAATSGPDEVRLIDVETGKETRRMKGPQNQGNQGFYHQQLSFSNDGKFLAMAGLQANDNVSIIEFLPIEEGKEGHTTKLEQQNAQFQIISPDHKTIAQWGYDQDVHILNVEQADAKELHKINMPQGLISFAYSADGKYLAGVDGASKLGIWDVSNGNAEQLKDALANSTISVMAFAPNGKAIAFTGGTSSMIRVVDIKKGKDLHAAAGHVGSINQVALSPDAKTLATIGEDHVVCLWNMANGKEIRRIDATGDEQPGVPFGGALAFSIDGKHLAITWANQPMKLYETGTGKEERSFGDADNPVNVGSVAFTPDGKFVAGVCTDGVVRFWDLRTGKEQRRYPEATNTEPPPEAKGEEIPVPAGAISMVAFSPDGKLMVTLGTDASDGTGLYSSVRIWELATGKERKSIRIKGGGAYDEVPWKGAAFRGALLDDIYPGAVAGTGIVISPNGRYVALTSGSTIHLVDLIKGKSIRQFGAQGESLCGAEFSPDGKMLVAGASDGALHFWEVATGTAIGEFNGHRGAITTLVYAPNGKSLVTGGVDTTALSWDVPFVLDSFKEDVKPLSRAEAEQFAAQLADEDGHKFSVAIDRLVQSPKEAVQVLKDRIKPVDRVSEQKIVQFVKDLSSDDYEVRAKATSDLEKLGHLAEPALHKRLEEGPDLEAKQRIEALLEKLGKPVDSPEMASALRIIEVLEKIGTPEARKVLEDLSKGADGAIITIEAKKSLARLTAQ